MIELPYFTNVGILAGDSSTMIFSSTDILGILGGNEVIKLSAKLSIVDGKPSLSGAEGLFIFIDRFPSIDEFQATWSIYIESDGSEPDDLVLAEIQQLLPSVSVKPGLLTTVTTTDFLSENTQRPPTPKPAKAQPDLRQYEERFQGLVEDVQDQMLLVTSGRSGKDGQDGRDGLDGRDGKDLVATEAELFDLQDVEKGIQMERGQVLTWDGTKWTNLYVPQTISAGGGGGGSESGGGGDNLVTSVNGQIGDVVLSLDDVDDVDAPAPIIGQALIWNGSAWHPGNVGAGGCNGIIDGGNLENGLAVAPDCLDSGADCSGIVDGGDVDTGSAYLFARVADGGDADTSTAFPPDCGTSGGGIGIEEAPIDGKQYAREDAAWTEVAPAGLQPGDNVSELVNDAGYIPEAPTDGNYYVRASGQWVKLIDALSSLGVLYSEPVDGGNFTDGYGTGTTNRVYDGGDFTNGETAAPDAVVIDGGIITP